MTAAGQSRHAGISAGPLVGYKNGVVVEVLLDLISQWSFSTRVQISLTLRSGAKAPELSPRMKNVQLLHSEVSSLPRFLLRSRPALKPADMSCPGYGNSKLIMLDFLNAHRVVVDVVCIALVGLLDCLSLLCCCMSALSLEQHESCTHGIVMTCWQMG